jgi:hypothetical protein
MRSLKWMALPAGVLAAALAAHAQTSWTVRSSVVPVKTLQSITWTGTSFITVGDSGTIFTSANGAAWTAQASGTGNGLYSVAYGGSKYVVVGQGGGIRGSTDGVNWEAKTSPTTSGLNSVTWTGSQFIAVGSGGVIVASADGSLWAARTSGVTTALNAVAAGSGSRIVTVGQGGVTRYSNDGVAWNTATGATGNLYAVAWVGDQFVAVGAGGAIFTSGDGISWTSRTSGVGNNLRAVTGSGSKIVVVGDGGTTLTSPDGTVWTKETSGTTSALYSIASSGSLLVAIGNAGLIRLSADGTGWSSPPNQAVTLNGVAWSSISKEFVTVGAGGTILASKNGATWSNRTSSLTSSILYAVTWVGDKFVAVGAGGTIIASDTGASWKAQTSGVTNGLYGVASNGSVVVAVGGGGVIRASTNGGTTWATRTSPVTTDLNAITWTGSRFVAVGAGGNIVTSTDGASWTGSPSGVTTTFYSVAGLGSTVVVSGAGGAVRTAPADLSSWSARTSGSTSILYALASNGTVVTAVGAAGTILVSTDGTTWMPQSAASPSALYAVAASDSHFVAVGANGALLTAPKVFLPEAPSLTTPSAAATGVPITPVLSWGALSGIASYQVQLSTDPTFAGASKETATSTSWAPATPLAANTSYHWRVAGVNGLGAGPFSASRQFTTGAAPTSAPVTPTLVSPASFATGVSVPTTLTWSSSSGAASYRLQVSLNPNFGTTVLDDSLVSGVSYNTAALTGSTTYYWRVRAKNSLGVSGWAEISSFTTVAVPPGVPVLSSPTGFATGVNVPITFTWEAALAALSYHIQVSTNSGFSPPATIVVNDSGFTGASRAVGSPLQATTEYYWRVRSKNLSGVSEFSEVRRFTSGIVVNVRGERLPSRAVSAEGGFLRFQLATRQRVVIKVYDSRGTLLSRLADEVREPGSHRLRLPAGRSAGLQWVDFRAGDLRQTLLVHP